MFRWISRLGRDVASLELWEILRRRGLRPAADRDPQALGRAVERCSACRSSAECSRLLTAGQDEKVAAFCPNVMYLSHLRDMERHAPKQDLL
jgi:hypothetical protein